MHVATILSLFSLHALQTFNIIDQNHDGLIDTDDLRSVNMALGKSQKYLPLSQYSNPYYDQSGDSFMFDNQVKLG